MHWDGSKNCEYIWYAQMTVWTVELQSRTLKIVLLFLLHRRVSWHWYELVYDDPTGYKAWKQPKSSSSKSAVMRFTRFNFCRRCALALESILGLCGDRCPKDNSMHWPQASIIYDDWFCLAHYPPTGTITKRIDHERLRLGGLINIHIASCRKYWTTSSVK